MALLVRLQPHPPYFGLLVIVVALGLCMSRAGVRFSHGPPKYILLDYRFRSTAFQVVETGSIPVQDTKICRQSCEESTYH